MTVAAGTVALNIHAGHERLLLMVLLIECNDEKVASSKKHTHFRTTCRMLKPYPN